MPSETISSRFLAGTIVGGLIGAVSALLLAPKKGTQLRGDLVDKYQERYGKTKQADSAIIEPTESANLQLVEAERIKESIANNWQPSKAPKQDEVILDSRVYHPN